MIQAGDKFIEQAFLDKNYTGVHHFSPYDIMELYHLRLDPCEKINFYTYEEGEYADLCYLVMTNTVIKLLVVGF